MSGMYQYLEIGNILKIPVYNLLIGIGAIWGFIYLEKEITHHKIDHQTDKKLLISLIIATGFGFIGAKLFEILYHGYDLTLINFLNGGITFMGGILVGAMSFIITNLFFHIKNLLAFNLLVPFVLLVHCFGRIGCFFAGCCFGKPTSSIFGIIYPLNSLPVQQFGANIHVHPTQLYEAAFLFIFFILSVNKIQFHLRAPIYFLAYGLVRFVLEYYRGDNRGQILTEVLTPSQLLSVIFIGIGLWSFLRLNTQKGITNFI